MNKRWSLVNVIFCKLIGGRTKFGSRGIISSMGSLRFVWKGISFSPESRIENEMDLERFVFDWDRDWSAVANGCIND